MGTSGENRGVHWEDWGAHGEDRDTHGEDRDAHGEDRGVHGGDRGAHGGPRFFREPNYHVPPWAIFNRAGLKSSSQGHKSCRSFTGVAFSFTVYLSMHIWADKVQLQDLSESITESNNSEHTQLH